MNCGIVPIASHNHEACTKIDIGYKNRILTRYDTSRSKKSMPNTKIRSRFPFASNSTSSQSDVLKVSHLVDEYNSTTSFHVHPPSPSSSSSSSSSSPPSLLRIAYNKVFLHLHSSEQLCRPSRRRAPDSPYLFLLHSWITPTPCKSATTIAWNYLSFTVERSGIGIEWYRMERNGTEWYGTGTEL